MKIKTKLLLALLFLSLVPVTVGGLFSYLNTKETLTDSFVNHLKSVASIQHDRLEDILARDKERLALVASRTQLRLSLARFNDSGNAAEQERMNRILEDALSSIPDFVAISVYSPEGIAVASTERHVIGTPHVDPTFFARSQREYSTDYLFLDADGKLRAYLAAPLELGGSPLGVILITSRVDNIISLVSDYSGLGKTGETLLVKRDAKGDAVLFTPTRFDRHAVFQRTFAKDKPYVCIASISGGTVPTDAIDYRGKPVLAIAKHIEAVGWGLVVKIDKKEAYEPVERLRAVLLVMVGLCFVIVVAAATMVARGISAPIDGLARVAGEIADGNPDRTATVSSADEIGLLAGAFNKMVGRLRQARTELEEKVDQLHVEIDAHERAEEEKERLIGELQKALAEIKTLKGIMPICVSCKKIRDDQGLWNQIEAYISQHSEADFSHGICPECAKKLYPDVELSSLLDEEEKG